VCHYKARPKQIVQYVQNVRRNIPQLVKKTPRDYLQSLRRQFSYVANMYSKMTLDEKHEYIKRLEGELAGRPCLENILESLIQALLKQDFVWIGKTKNFENTPLKYPNNVRYLGFGPNLKGRGGLVNTAIQTWQKSTNRPKNFNSMNITARKDMFWKMIKNLPVLIEYQGQIGNASPSMFNINGKKFKNSELASTLEYIM